MTYYVSSGTLNPTHSLTHITRTMQNYTFFHLLHTKRKLNDVFGVSWLTENSWCEASLVDKIIGAGFYRIVTKLVHLSRTNDSAPVT